jgi:hypothetical protein
VLLQCAQYEDLHKSIHETYVLNITQVFQMVSLGISRILEEPRHVLSLRLSRRSKSLVHVLPPFFLLVPVGSCI